MAFAQSGEQHHLSTRKFQRMAVIVRAIIQMTHTGDAVRKLLPWSYGECALVYNRPVEGQFRTGCKADRDHGLSNRGKPARYRIREAFRNQPVADFGRA